MKPNAEFMKQHFIREGRLTEEQALYIIGQAMDLLSREPNLVNVESPVTSEFPVSCSVYWSHADGLVHNADYLHAVCGDIHGQYVSSWSAEKEFST